MPQARLSRAHRSCRSQLSRKAACGRAPWTTLRYGFISNRSDRHVADPLPICYLNGAYPPLEEARISPLDRGFLYADGVYEVMPVYGGRPFRFGAHCDRLARSLAEIRMRDPHTRDGWREILGEVIA